MPFVDEHLYYAVDMKQKTLEMTEKGREFITTDKEGDEFFVIPDLGTETSIIEEEIEKIRKKNEDS
jgi:preprotein translocase subunit SecA